MGFKEFMSEVRSRGVASRSHFVVELTPPSFLLTSSEVLTVIPLFCEQTMFPEFMSETQVVKDGGLSREVVFDKRYGQVSMTFTCDQQMIIKEFFDKWVQAPVQKDGGLFLYPSKYIVPAMTVFQIDEKKQKVYGVTIRNVYPKIVNDVFMSASDRSVTSFQVVFAYESWDSVRYTVDLSYPPPAPSDTAPNFNISQGKPKFMIDIAQILDYAKLGKEGAKSAIITRGTKAITDILGTGKTSITTGGIPGLDAVRNFPGLGL